MSTKPPTRTGTPKKAKPPKARPPKKSASPPRDSDGKTTPPKKAKPKSPPSEPDPPSPKPKENVTPAAPPPAPEGDNGKTLKDLLTEQALEEYYDILKEKGINTPTEITTKLSFADVEEMTADKPVHQRKLAALVRGKGLHGNKFTVDMDENGRGGTPGRRSTPSARTPTPSRRADLGPEVKGILSARGQVMNEFGRKSAEVQKHETMKATYQAIKELEDSSTQLSPAQLVSLVSRNGIRCYGEKRFAAICAVKILSIDVAACDEKFWRSLDENKKPFGPIMSDVMNIKHVPEVIKVIPDLMTEKKELISLFLKPLKANIPKKARQFSFSSSRSRSPFANKERAAQQEKMKEDHFNQRVNEATPQMQQDVKMINILNNEVSKMHSDTQELRNKSKESVAKIKRTNLMMLSADDFNGDMQQMCEAEFAAMLEVLQAIVDETNILANKVARIYDEVKAKITKEMDKLEGDETYRKMVGYDLLSDRSKGLIVNIKVPPGISPGMSFRATTAAGAMVEVTVPEGVQPGDTLTVKLDKSLNFRENEGDATGAVDAEPVTNNKDKPKENAPSGSGGGEEEGAEDGEVSL